MQTAFAKLACSAAVARWDDEIDHQYFSDQNYSSSKIFTGSEPRWTEIKYWDLHWKNPNIICWTCLGQATVCLLDLTASPGCYYDKMLWRTREKKWFLQHFSLLTAAPLLLIKFQADPNIVRLNFLRDERGMWAGLGLVTRYLVNIEPSWDTQQPYQAQLEQLGKPSKYKR